MCRDTASNTRSAASGGSLVRIVSLVSGLFATTTAQAAASKADEAADSADHAVAVAATQDAGLDAALNESLAP